MSKRTQFEEMVLLKALAFKCNSSNSDILDLVASDQVEHNIELKNVCAKVSPQLADRLDEVCVLLSISKRRFVEAALIEALNKAETIMHEDVDIFEHMGAPSSLVAVEESK